MDKYELVSKIEKFAPLETQESWDCSGWIVDNKEINVNKVMLALTVTDDIIRQAKNKKCDMIISHHPLFKVPVEYKDINIYASHTPMDKAKGGTTDTLVEILGFKPIIEDEFVRIVEFKSTVDDLKQRLQRISPNLRLINNINKRNIKRIGFCAGSGSEFINSTNVDAFITGDIKYHTAVETDKIVFDIGHFESEIHILKKIQEILDINVEFANEKSPFI